jgi:gluconate kinase
MSQSRISLETWEQVKIAYAAGAGLRELARRMNIPEGTVLAHAKRKGWTQQIQAAKQDTKSMQSNAIMPFAALATTLNERKDKSRLHLSK